MGVLVFSLSLMGCPFDGGRDSDGKYCLMYVASNGATLRFDGTALSGKEVQIKSDGQLVYDSCQGGAQSPSIYQYTLVLNGSQSSIGRMISKQDPLPTGETLTLLSRASCSDPVVSVGSATVTYSFQYHPEDKECNHDYYSDEQNVAFQ